jgi:hypothetical protein
MRTIGETKRNQILILGGLCGGGLVLVVVGVLGSFSGDSPAWVVVSLWLGGAMLFAGCLVPRLIAAAIMRSYRRDTYGSGQSSVRNGDAGSRSRLSRSQSGQ